MMKRFLLIPFLCTPALADSYLAGHCITDQGVVMDFGLQKGFGFISYNNSEPQKIYSFVENEMVNIINIGNVGQMKFVMNYNGRGYFVTRKDGKGITAEGNVICDLSMKGK